MYLIKGKDDIEINKILLAIYDYSLTLTAVGRNWRVKIVRNNSILFSKFMITLQIFRLKKSINYKPNCLVYVLS